MAKVVHFEIPADDLDRAKNFYGSVFGWQLETMAMPQGGEYTSVVTTPVDQQTQMPTEPGAINGGMVQRDELASAAPVITVDVENIDDALREIEANGGSTVTPRTAIQGMGAFAYFKDSEGNVIGLWETSG
ncbi:VOC family protein [Microlunatus ginsengisoli]|uniref:VOC family protein n=1 Tax=Microlunatus ginsengisoli TaxID=363863 RepID=A0ABP7B032_9ACTN